MLPPVAGRFVAGETTTSALEHVATLNDRSIGAICNLLGEHYDDPVAAEADAIAYRELVRSIDAKDLDAAISVKPTQLGLDVDESVFRGHLRTIVEEATDAGVFVWLDMEDHTTTDATLAAFEAEARRTDGRVGVCLQANLKRTRADLERLAGTPGRLRLVKGAYREPRSIAYRDPGTVNTAYRALLEAAFEQGTPGVALGTHDPAMLSFGATCSDRTGTPYEIQMLMGVREDTQRELASDHRMVQYVPYGPRWLSYFYRRVIERRENLLFALRALWSR